jgi:hypothetical protein
VADTEKVGEVQLGETEFDATQGTQAEDLKRFIGQLASIG